MPLLGELLFLAVVSGEKLLWREALLKPQRPFILPLHCCSEGRPGSFWCILVHCSASLFLLFPLEQWCCNKIIPLYVIAFITFNLSH